MMRAVRLRENKYMDVILKSGLIKILDDFIIGRSNSYSCGWINTDDLRKIADMIC